MFPCHSSFIILFIGCASFSLSTTTYHRRERKSSTFSKINPTFSEGLFLAYCDANFECWEKSLDYYVDVWYNNGRKRIFAESDSRFPDSIHIPPKRAWPQLWPSTVSDYVETVLTRAFESIVFGHESPEKPCKSRKKSAQISLGRRCRRFESCHSDHIECS